MILFIWMMVRDDSFPCIYISRRCLLMCVLNEYAHLYVNTDEKCKCKESESL